MSQPSSSNFFKNDEKQKEVNSRKMIADDSLKELSLLEKAAARAIPQVDFNSGHLNKRPFFDQNNSNNKALELTAASPGELPTAFKRPIEKSLAATSPNISSDANTLLSEVGKGDVTAKKSEENTSNRNLQEEQNEDDVAQKVTRNGAKATSTSTSPTVSENGSAQSVTDEVLDLSVKPSKPNQERSLKLEDFEKKITQEELMKQLYANTICQKDETKLSSSYFSPVCKKNTISVAC